jgi:hypothetical protein
MYDAWTHPRTLSIISSIAGIDLVPVIDIEIGNINVSVQDPNKDPSSVDEVAVTKWHVDSYPFVCVVMMSDASNMIGGETAIQNGSGEILKIRGPQMVSPFSIPIQPSFADEWKGLRRCSSGSMHHTPGSRCCGRH